MARSLRIQRVSRCARREATLRQINCSTPHSRTPIHFFHLARRARRAPIPTQGRLGGHQQARRTLQPSRHRRCAQIQRRRQNEDRRRALAHRCARQWPAGIRHDGLERGRAAAEDRYGREAAGRLREAE